MKKYVEQRQNEVLKQNSELLKKNKELEVFIALGFEFIERKVSAQYDTISPEAARRVEMLETIMMSFIDHGNDFDLLEVMEGLIYKKSGPPRAFR